MVKNISKSIFISGSSFSFFLFLFRKIVIFEMFLIERTIVLQIYIVNINRLEAGTNQ